MSLVVNNASQPQVLPTLLISPAGEIFEEASLQLEQTIFRNIDLNDVIEALGARVDF